MLRRSILLFLPVMARAVFAQTPDLGEELTAVRKQYVKGETALLAGKMSEAESAFAKAFELASEVHRKFPEDPDLNQFIRRLQETFEQLQAIHKIAIIVAPPAKKEVPAVAQELPKIDLYAHSIQVSAQLSSHVKKNLQRARYDLPVVLNSDVLRAMDFFLKNPHGRKLMMIGFERIGLYEDHIRETFRKEGIPTDLIYLAQLESNFFPNAVSTANAVGMWQFVADTAMRYGLKMDWWVDERLDPYKATKAAARYLKSLHEQLGDWYLVLASYNTGEGRIIPLAQKGLRDFWTISDRKLVALATRQFVPLILAIAIISKNAAEFGLPIERTPPVRFETITLDRPISLKVVARRLKVDLDDLQELNPELQHDLTPQYLRHYPLRIPPGVPRKAIQQLTRLSARERMGG
jgi:membrane-bound lytic murein transglycosylase D